MLSTEFKFPVQALEAGVSVIAFVDLRLPSHRDSGNDIRVEATGPPWRGCREGSTPPPSFHSRVTFGFAHNRREIIGYHFYLALQILSHLQVLSSWWLSECIEIWTSYFEHFLGKAPQGPNTAFPSFFPIPAPHHKGDCRCGWYVYSGEVRSSAQAWEGQDPGADAASERPVSWITRRLNHRWWGRLHWDEL